MQNEPKYTLRSNYKNNLTYMNVTNYSMPNLMFTVSSISNFFLETIFICQNYTGDSIYFHFNDLF